MTKNTSIFLIAFLISFNSNGIYTQEDSLAGSFLSGLLDTITNTADSKDCPGVCVHTLATLICYDVLEDVPCPSKNMKCCIESAGTQHISSTESTPVNSISSTTKTPSLSSTATKDNNQSIATSQIKNKVTTATVVLSKPTKPAEKHISDVLNCSGVCVADKIAEYCEAFYTSKGRCKTGSKCCVSLDEFINKELPSDLYIPAKHLINLGLEQAAIHGNASNSGNTKFVKQKDHENNFKNITTTENQLDADLTKATEISTVNANKQSKIKKKKNPKPINSAEGTAASIKDNEKFDKTVELSGPELKQCAGECMNGILAIFCDDIDSDAVCPGEGSCCINNIVIGTTTVSQNTSTSKPIKQTVSLKHELKPTGGPPQTPLPSLSGSDLFSQILSFAESTLNSPVTSTPSNPITTQSIPTCPGFCLLNIMAAFCEPPSTIVNSLNACNRGSVCCDNSKISHQEQPNESNSHNTPLVIPNTPQPDPREPCPGSCIVSLLRFTCFKNAELTHLFKCKRTGQTCCAPKSKILDKQQFQTRNDTAYLTGQHIPTQEHFLYAAPVTQKLQSNTAVELSTTTTRFPIYSKYVCGVKGTLRSNRKSKTSLMSFTSYARAVYGLSRSARQISKYSLEHKSNKLNERLMLGTELVPIQINNNLIGSSYNTNNIELNYNTTTFKSSRYRNGRVVNGEDAENGEWCWQVALINSANQYLCGGGLIGTQWVLTAAHCVTNIVRLGDAIYVRVGDYDLTRKYGSPGAQTLRVATTYIHHNHNSQTLDNDIALLKLHGQAELRDGVCLVCLPARGVNHAAGKRCTVTGYGYMGETGPIPLRIREAELPIVSDTECIRKVNAVTEKIFILPASSFCAGGEENDACQGDGGGPLVCEDDGFYELAGLVSWGFGCGRLDVPGVYVKVSSFIGWVNQIISVNNL